jgi:hypothetical protein
MACDTHGMHVTSFDIPSGKLTYITMENHHL